jgi:hypothetical protein
LRSPPSSSFHHTAPQDPLRTPTCLQCCVVAASMYRVLLWPRSCRARDGGRVSGIRVHCSVCTRAGRVPDHASEFDSQKSNHNRSLRKKPSTVSRPITILCQIRRACSAKHTSSATGVNPSYSASFSPTALLVYTA